MTDAVVIFSKAYARPSFGSAFPNFPVMMGASARSEAIAIGALSVKSTLDAGSSDEYVTVVAGAACWVAIGPDPTAAALASGGTSTGVSWPLAANQIKEFSVSKGDKVAVIQA